MRYAFYAIIFLMIVLAGCKDDPVTPEPVRPPALAKAVYILNEGDFSDPVGARLTMYDLDSNLVYRDVFEAANGGQHLGNLGDDMRIFNGKAYVVLSGSEKIMVIDLGNHQLLQSASYPGDSPKDMVIDSVRGKIYVSRLYKHSILVIDLTTLAVLDSIQVGTNPQAMLLNGTDLFVCNTGFGSDKTVSVVDVLGDTVRTTLTLSDGPVSAMLASDGNVWIACSGNAFASPPTTGRIFMVNPATLAREDSLWFTANLWGCLSQGINGFVYVVGMSPGSFYGGPVHRIDVATKGVTPNYVTGGAFYSMTIEPVSGDLYIADAMSFSADGVVNIFNKDGGFRRSFTVQKGPGAIAFKR